MPKFSKRDLKNGKVGQRNNIFQIRKGENISPPFKELRISWIYKPIKEITPKEIKSSWNSFRNCL